MSLAIWDHTHTICITCDPTQVNTEHSPP